jgi:hypothetical protein
MIVDPPDLVVVVAAAVGVLVLVVLLLVTRALAAARRTERRLDLFERLQRPVRELLPGRDGGEGLPEHVVGKFAHPETDETPIPKLRAPEHVKIVVAGGTAGRFSAIVPGWTFPQGSNLVFRKIHLREEAPHG